MKKNDEETKPPVKVLKLNREKLKDMTIRTGVRTGDFSVHGTIRVSIIID